MKAIHAAFRLGMSILLLGVGMETGTALFLWLALANFVLFILWSMQLGQEAGK